MSWWSATRAIGSSTKGSLMTTKFFVNALGKALYYSGASKYWYSATGLKSGSMLYGTASNDTIYGDAAVNVTMSGGAGDDIYYVYSNLNHVTEAGGGGIDTL